MTPEELAAELTAPEFLLGRWKIGAKPNFWDNVFFADWHRLPDRRRRKPQIRDLRFGQMVGG